MSAPILIEAWGETKSLHAWGRDPRAKVKPRTIGYRLKAGRSAEEAIGGEASQSRKAGVKSKEAKRVKVVTIKVNEDVVEKCRRYGVRMGQVLREAAEAAELRAVERVAIMDEARGFCLCGYRVDLCAGECEVKR